MREYLPVFQLKKLLNERKMQEWKELDNVSNALKKSANIIDECINSVNGLLGHLNSEIRGKTACVIIPRLGGKS